MYYIGGDFNADLLKSNSDINIKDFMNLTYSLGCIPLITHPTRIKYHKVQSIAYQKNDPTLSKVIVNVCCFMERSEL